MNRLHLMPLRRRLPHVGSMLFGTVLLGAMLLGANAPSFGAQAAEGGQLRVQGGRGPALFAKHCALCHGATGAADGPAAELLFPPARDFRQGIFKLTSTLNGVPTDADLIHVLRRGIPGSAMPGWSWMPKADLTELAGHVRSLAVQGVARGLAGDDEGLSQAECLQRAEQALTPGEPVSIAAGLVVDAGVLERGALLYANSCSGCHGADGRGRPDLVQRDADETRNHARDFTTGILKGGGSRADLARRIQVGLHGTSMPDRTFSEEDLGALVAHLQTLIPAGSDQRLVQRRRSIHAARVGGPLLLNPRHRQWQDVDDVEIVLAPLWWEDGAILHAEVAALHDGETLGVRVRWSDGTADAPSSPRPPYDAPPYADAVALQLAERSPDGEGPPRFGMAGADTKSNIWYWRADGFLGLKSMADMGRFIVHDGYWSNGRVVSDLPVVNAAPGPIWIVGEAEAVAPDGMQRMLEQKGLDSWVEASPRWMDGVWEVVLARTLEPGSEAEIPLSPGSSAWINLAIWNGAVRDLRGKKSLTLWHTIELAN